MRTRLKESDLQRIIKREKYGIKGGTSSSVGKRAARSEDNHSGAKHNLEHNFGMELEGTKKLQINSASKILVRIKFYRHRLADYSRAISEKALLDCAVYAGLLRADSEKEIQLIDEGQEKVGSKEEERTELTIEYPDVDFDNLWVASKRTDGR